MFGWSRVGPDGEVRIPPEALEEYDLQEHLAVILVSGSRTSGGFGMMKPNSIEASPIGGVLDECPTLTDERSEEALTEWKGRVYARVTLQCGSFSLPTVDSHSYGYDLRTGDLLLVVRGSYVGPSFLSRGPLIQEARQHPELDIFE